MFIFSLDLHARKCHALQSTFIESIEATDCVLVAHAQTICLLNPCRMPKKLATDLFVEPLTNVRELVHLQVGKLSHKASPTSPILAYIHHSETESKH